MSSNDMSSDAFKVVRAVENLFKIHDEITHDKVPASKKKLSFIECGIDDKDIIDVLLKMKGGCHSSIKLGLDNEDSSEALWEFRLLSAQEEADIQDAMDKTKYIPQINPQYFIYLASKTLAAASSSSLGNNAPNGKSPRFTEEYFRNTFPASILAGLSIKYNDFKRRVSPKLEEFTEEMLNEILEEIDATEASKKFDIISCLSSTVMPEVILGLYNKLENVTKQLDKFVIGG